MLITTSEIHEEKQNDGHRLEGSSKSEVDS